MESTISTDNKIDLRSIYDLLEYKFYIPAYQRGYRWDALQVEQLLDDIWEFKKKNKKTNEFYCLQPFAVRRREDSWEVIDGQQRLTTIRIILSYLVTNHLQRTLKEAYKKTEFSIQYETRPSSEQFLKDIKENTEDIDFYHIWRAYIKTQEWFSNKDYDDCNDFLSILLAKEDSKNPVKVIWYEVNDSSDSYDIFTRLNIGKIQLTNSELIKALFLKKWNNEEAIDKIRLKQLKIASEWDRIENTLQDNAFWYFIYNQHEKEKPKYANRIEYIFDLMKGKLNEEDDKYTFYEFYTEFEKSKENSQNKIPDTDGIWLKIKKYFLTFEEWFKDRELYHLIGFLITIDYRIQDLLEPKEKGKKLEIKSKTAFKQFLTNEIKKKTNHNIREFNYGDTRIKTILLLFNIQTILDNDKSNMRFPFDLYKDGKWDIEHVRSQTDKSMIGNDRKEWAKDILEYYTGSNKREKQEEFIARIEKEENEIFKTILGKVKLKSLLTELLEISNSDKIDEQKFNDIYKEICEEFKENNEPSKCAISNLALLDAATNRSYKNAFFPIKRKIILENDKKGTFIPICTKNVFMKAYSKRFDEIMYWNKYDAEFYLQAIEETLNKYLPNKVNENAN